MIEVWYLEGRVCAYQPDQGYRAGLDAVLLAQSLVIKPNAKVMELGTGSACALLVAHYNQPTAQYTGVEINPNMLKVAQHNTAKCENIEILTANVGTLANEYHLQYDIVFANPPYFDAPENIRMSDAKAPSFVAGESKLVDWISQMLRVLKPRGTGTLIYRADGLEHILRALEGKAGRIRVLPIHSFCDEPAKRIIVQFRTGVKSESALLPPLILHEKGGLTRYTSKTQEILDGKRTIDL